MKTRLALLTVLLFPATTLASSLTLQTSAWVDNSPDVNWWGGAWYLNDAGEPGVGVPMSGNLTLYNEYDDLEDNVPWSTYGGSWQGTYVDTLDYDDCFYTAMNARTFDQFQTAYATQMGCTGDPPYGGGGYDYCDFSGCYSCDMDGYCCDEFGDCEEEQMEDPIVIRLSEPQWKLSSLRDPVQFDIHANGKKTILAWTAEGADIAFLALDRNGNGTIDDGSELFGNATPLPNGQPAPNGFAALAQYDANGDGVIDRNDPIWTALLLWVDRNHDGISQPDELTPVAQSAITSIELAHHWSGRRDPSRNFFRFEGLVHFGNRTSTFYDVFFVARPR